MKDARTRSNAEFLFIRRGKTLDEIAAEISVSKGTLARWSKDGGWTAKRSEYMRNSKRAPVEKLKARRERLIDQMSDDPNQDLTAEDRLAKLQKVIETLEGKDALGPVLDVMEEFARFVRDTTDDATAAAICAATEKFLQRKREEAT